MPFQRTVDSLFPLVSQMEIRREHAIADLLITYERQLEQRENHTSLPDHGLLEQARTLLVERLNTLPFDTELALLGHYIYLESGAFDECASFLQRYLASPRSTDEEAWARWHRVDALALARHCPETIQEQKQLLQFTLKHFPVQQCLFVLSDGTQARSWEEEGWGDQWIALVESLMRQVQPDNDNRTDCFYVLRTAAYVCLSLQWTKQAQHYAQAIRLLQDEQPDVAQRQRYLIEASLIDLKLAHQIADTQAINRIGTHLTHLLATWEADVQGLPLNSERVRQYRMLCHNVAAPLYRARQYQLAIPLFRRAILYGTMPSEPFLWLAACIWATTPPTPECRNDVGALLAQAARRYDDGSDPWQRFRALPEFENVDFEREFGEIIYRTNR